MADCDAFFGMLFERHGTPITLTRDPAEARASVSFFEAELLNASMTRKPILIAQASELRPGEQLADFLRLVSGNLGSRIVDVDRRSLPALFEDFCRSLPAVPTDTGMWLFDTISLGRVRRSVTRELTDPRLCFLGGALREDGHATTDHAVIAAAIDRVEVGQASDGLPLGQLEKLSYLWAALRELAKATVADRQHELYADTIRVLGSWNSSAAGTEFMARIQWGAWPRLMTLPISSRRLATTICRWAAEPAPIIRSGLNFAPNAMHGCSFGIRWRSRKRRFEERLPTRVDCSK